MVNKYKIANKVVEVTSIYYEVHEYWQAMFLMSCLQRLENLGNRYEKPCEQHYFISPWSIEILKNCVI